MTRAGAIAAIAVCCVCMSAALAQEEPAPASQGNFFSKMFGTDTRPQLERLRAKPYQPSNQAIGVERDLLNQRASAYGLVSADGLEKYANRVLDKLKQAAGIPGLPGSVYLLATDDLAAVTTADGNIYISYRWFENLNQSTYAVGQEDTLAGLLAHELGHIALGHHNSDMFSIAAKWAQRYYTQAIAIKTALEQKSNGAVALPAGAVQNVKKMQLMVEVMDKMLHPAWKRGQEEEADAFAVDVTKAAGYTYQEGVKRFLEINNSAAQAQQEREKQRLTAMQSDVDASLKAGNLDAAINGVGKQLGDQMKSMLGATHPDPVARTAKLGEYVAKYHKSDWYEDAEPAPSKEYLREAKTTQNAELFEMYNKAFELENQFATLDPDKIRKAVADGDKLTRKIGLKNVDRNNWLLFYEYARAMRFAAELAPSASVAEAPAPVAVAPAKPGKKGKAAPVQAPREAPGLKQEELDLALTSGEAAMSFKPYEDSIKIALKAGNRAQALELLTKTDKKFDLARSTLPKTIAFYRQAGKPERSSELATLCETRYMDMRDECRNAAKAQ